MRQVFKTILTSLLIALFHDLNQEIIIRYSMSYKSIHIAVMKSLLTHHQTSSLYLESKLKWCNPNYLSVFHFQSLIIEKSSKQYNTWLLKYYITMHSVQGLSDKRTTSSRIYLSLKNRAFFKFILFFHYL